MQVPYAIISIKSLRTAREYTDKAQGYLGRLIASWVINLNHRASTLSLRSARSLMAIALPRHKTHCLPSANQKVAGLNDLVLPFQAPISGPLFAKGAATKPTKATKMDWRKFRRAFTVISLEVWIFLCV